MTFKFEQCVVNDQDLDSAKKAAALFNEFRETMRANGFDVHGITVRYNLKDLNKYVTINI